MSALGEVQVTRAQRVAHRERERELPQPPVRPVAAVEQRDAAGARYELDGCVRRQLVELAGLELAADVDRGQQRISPLAHAHVIPSGTYHFVRATTTDNVASVA